MNRKLLGRYTVADPEVCGGKPTFRGTRIMIWQVLEQKELKKSSTFNRMAAMPKPIKFVRCDLLS